MNLPIVVLGGGGHSRVVLDVLQAMSREVLGVIDPKSDLVLPDGVKHIGADLTAFDPQRCLLVIGIGSADVGTRNHRPRLFLEGKAGGFTFATLQHPSAIVAPCVEIGEGSQIMAAVAIQPCVRPSRNVILSTSASIDHDCRIEDHVHVAPGVILSGDVKIGEGVHLGTGAIVVQGASIGAGAMIGAGVVVTESVPAGARVRLRP